MTDAAMRARVVRLVSGDVRADDLSRLFLYARDRCDGREAVKEIGDFVAHHSERTKGILTRGAREWFATARFAAATAGRRTDPTRLPPVTPDFLHANVQRIAIKSLRKAGYTRSAAIKAVPELCGKLRENSDGTFAIPVSLTKAELALIEALISEWVAKPAFTGERLCDDFFATLRSNGLISSAELNTPYLRMVVQLFAIANIHGCEAIMPDGTPISLQVMGDGKLSITAAVPVLRETGKNIRIASFLFTTDLDRQEHCDPTLDAREPWNGTVELGPDRKLHFLG